MGYGFGAFLTAVGLILALAVQDSVEGVDLTMVGWIVAGVGLALVALTAVTMNSANKKRAVATTTHRDGSQTVHESEADL